MMKAKIFSLLIITFFISCIQIYPQQLIQKSGNYNYIILDNGVDINVVDKDFKIIGQMMNATNVESYRAAKDFIVMKEKNGYLVSYDIGMRELGRITMPPNFKDNDYKLTDNYILIKR